MELRRCSNGITNSRTHPAVGGDIAIVPTGSVHGRYLLDTKEYGEDGGVAHEGEVKVAVVCENLTHSSLWTVFPMDGFRGLFHCLKLLRRRWFKLRLSVIRLRIAYRNGGVFLHDEVVVEWRHLWAFAVAR